jgi:hypothetical protein
MKKFNNLALILTALSTLLTPTAQTKPVCEHLSDCLVLQAEVAARVRELSPKPTVRKSISGYLFTQVTNHPELGSDVWKDESGLIWSDGKEVETSVQRAQKYCISIGARLPTAAEFDRLSVYLGRESDFGYYPEFLPNIGLKNFWTSSVDATRNKTPFVFYGDDGEIKLQYYAGNRVRCVIQE